MSDFSIGRCASNSNRPVYGVRNFEGKSVPNSAPLYKSHTGLKFVTMFADL